MAAAVENSAAVVCFLTQQYQDSPNCKDEFKYARKKNKPIIPCLINPGWKPDGGWLDIGLNDLLYIDFKKVTKTNFELKCEELLTKIKQVVKAEDILMSKWIKFFYFSDQLLRIKSVQTPSKSSEL
jgi:hypothetical protein